MPFTKTTWVDGSEPAITATQLNRIEAGIEDAHAGDLDAASIDTAVLVDKAVTNGKFRDSVGPSVVGRAASSTGSVADISAGSDGQVLRRASGSLGFGTVATAGIGDLQVTTGKLAAGAVTTAKIGDAQVTTAKIGDGQVTTAKIGDGQVTTAKIGDTEVTNAKIATGVDASKLTTGTLPIARIADGAVTNAKLASDLDASKLTTGTLPIARIAANDIDVSKIVATGLAGYVAKTARSQVAGTESFNLIREATSFQNVDMIFDYVPLASGNLIVLVLSALVKLERLTAGTSMGAEFQFTQNAGAITGTLKEIARVFPSSTPADTQQVTFISAFNAGSTTARTYGFQLRVVGANQRVSILRQVAREQLFVFEFAV